MTQQGRWHNGSRPFLLHSLNRVKHFQLRFDREPIATFNLHGGRTGAQHRIESRAQTRCELLTRGFAHRPHGRMNAATTFLNLSRRHSAQLLRPVIERIARPASVSVAIDKTRHEHPAVSLNHLSIGWHRKIRSDRRNLALRHQYVATCDHAELTHRNTSAWTHSALRTGVYFRLSER